MTNPYSNLPQEAFWRSAIAEKNPLDIADVWEPKHPIRKAHKIATAGSCFAQHIGRALVARNYNWLDAEPAPKCVGKSLASAYNYGVFSFRTGNIYTTRALKQWVYWALGKTEMPDEVWEKDGRFFDPFRPNIEPDGFASVAELHASRQSTLNAIRRTIDEAHFFVFTLGLTEGWINTEHDYTYAMCPGTVAGAFDPAVHVFKNFTYPEIHSDLSQALNAMSAQNRRMRFLLTVSPVPLTATASGHHVLVATTHSKSVLRAVAGEVAQSKNRVDYFPSYEIITGTPFRGMFFEPNMRSVSPHGVNFVMKNFFSKLPSEQSAGENGRTQGAEKPGRAAGGDQGARRPSARPESQSSKSADDIVCEEEMLEAFAG